MLSRLHLSIDRPKINLEQKMTTLNTEIAEIVTATVEIQSMVINNKKVTLSLFRQFPEKRPRISVGGLTATIMDHVWGIVRYTWGGQNGVHVVYVDGKGELHRFLFDQNYQRQRLYITAEEIESFDGLLSASQQPVPRERWLPNEEERLIAQNKRTAVIRQQEVANEEIDDMLSIATSRIASLKTQIMAMRQLFIAV